MGFGFEGLGLPPDVQEHLAHEILGQRLVSRQAENEPVHPNIMPGIEHLHGPLVAVGNEANERPVRRFLRRTPQVRRRKVAQHILILHNDPLLVSP